MRGKSSQNMEADWLQYVILYNFGYVRLFVDSCDVFYFTVNNFVFAGDIY